MADPHCRIADVGTMPARGADDRLPRHLPRIERERGQPAWRGARRLVVDLAGDGDAGVLGADMPAMPLVDLAERAGDDQRPPAGLRRGGIGANRVIAEPAQLLD